MSPWLRLRRPTHPPASLTSPARAPSLRSVGLHVARWMRVRAAAAAKEASGLTHIAHHTLLETSRRLGIHRSPVYHPACIPDRSCADDVAGGGGDGGGEGLCGVVVSPLSAIQVLWNGFHSDDTGTFPFPSNQKMPRDERFKPELTSCWIKA